MATSKNKKLPNTNNLDTIINVYNKIPEEMKSKPVTYKNHKFLNIDIPANIGVFGMTGSQKTTLAYDLISKIDIFEFYILCVKQVDEPIYEYMISKIPKKQLFVCTSLKEIPPLETLKEYENILCIIDDQINSKNAELGAATEYVTRGRKAGISHSGVTTFFISQSFYKTPITLRNNCQYFFIMKTPNAKEMNRMVNEFPQVKDNNREEVLRYLKNLKAGQFLLVDNKTQDPKLMLRTTYSGNSGF